MKEVVHVGKDRRKKVVQWKEKSLSQNAQGPSIHKEHENPFVMLERLDLNKDNAMKESIQLRDLRKGKVKEKAQEKSRESKAEFSNVSAKADECTPKINNEQPIQEWKEVGEETTSSCKPFGDRLNVDEKDLLKGISGNLSKKQKRKVAYATFSLECLYRKLS